MLWANLTSPHLKSKPDDVFQSFVVMMTDLKKWLFKKRISRDQKKMIRPKKSGNNPLEKIALLFDSTIPGEAERAKKLMEFVQRSGKKLRALAYVETIENALHIACPIYSIKQINWFDIPISMDVVSFINFEADLLILLNPKKDLHKNYILAVSKARIKAGIANYDEFDQYYDFLVDVTDQKSKDINVFFDIYDTVLSFN